MTLTPAESAAAQALIDLALAEDLGDRGDVTSAATIPADAVGAADFIARSPGVLAGLPVAILVTQTLDPRLTITVQINDRARLQRGDVVATLAGPMRSLLSAERTALNFMQRLSGVATLTRQYVDIVAGRAQVLDTRKTTPGWRLLEKYAVRCGGGHNHRMGLFDGVLIKDNHLAGSQITDFKLQIEEALRRAVSIALPIEIEVDRLEQLDVALAVRPAIILLDNMPLDRLRESVRRRDAVAPGVLLEASGGVNLTTIDAIAGTGVDRISVGALTHSAPALDIALDYRTN